MSGAAVQSAMLHRGRRAATNRAANIARCGSPQIRSAVRQVATDIDRIRRSQSGANRWLDVPLPKSRLAVACSRHVRQRVVPRRSDRRLPPVLERGEAPLAVTAGRVLSGWAGRAVCRATVFRQCCQRGPLGPKRRKSARICQSAGRPMLHLPRWRGEMKGASFPPALSPRWTARLHSCLSLADFAPPRVPASTDGVF